MFLRRRSHEILYNVLLDPKNGLEFEPGILTINSSSLKHQKFGNHERILVCHTILRYLA